MPIEKITVKDIVNKATIRKTPAHTWRNMRNAEQDLLALRKLLLALEVLSFFELGSFGPTIHSRAKGQQQVRAPDQRLY